MGTQTEKDQKPNPGMTDPLKNDPSKKNPSHEGGQHQPNPSQKHPPQVDEDDKRSNEETADMEKRRAS